MGKTPKKYFTQKDLEKHINERLVRERKKYSELEMLRKMTDELMENGTIDANSYAEAAERLKALLYEMTAGNREDSENGKNGEGKSDTEEPMQTESQGANDDIDESSDNAVMMPRDSDDTDSDTPVSDNDGETTDTSEFPFRTVEDIEREEQMKDASADSEKSDAEKADSGNTMAKLSEICTAILELVNSEKERQEIKKTTDDARKNVCSTGFSKSSSSDMQEYFGTLTPTQREIAKRAGLSYREYAELLSQIPQSGKKRKQ